MLNHEIIIQGIRHTSISSFSMTVINYNLGEKMSEYSFKLQVVQFKC